MCQHRMEKKHGRKRIPFFFVLIGLLPRSDRTKNHKLFKQNNAVERENVFYGFKTMGLHCQKEERKVSTVEEKRH